MAYVISEDCIACGTCIDECQWAQFLKVTFTQLTLTCAQSAALVLMFAQVAQFLQDKLQNCF